MATVLWGGGAAGGGAANPVLRFYDTFTDTDGVSLTSHLPNTDESGLGWYALNGTWDIQDNQARCSDATAAYRAVVMDAATPNVTLTCKLAAMNGNTNIIGRVLDGSNHLQINIYPGGGTMQIAKRDGGTVTTLVSTSYTASDGDIVKVEFNGTTVTVYINNVQKLTTITTFMQYCTLFGFSKPGVSGTVQRWDDFRIEHIGAMPSVPSIVGADVFLLVGQSNGSGRGTNLNAATGGGIFTNSYKYRALVDPVDSRVHQVDSVSSEPNNPSRGSVWPGVMTAIMNQTGRTAYIVPCNLGGSTINQWQPGANHQDRTTLYGSAIYRALQAQAAGGILRAALMWEGENDAQAAISQSSFNSYLDTLANAIDTDLNIPTIPCKLQQLLGGYSVANVNAAIVEAQGDNANVLVGPDLSGLTSDNDDGLGSHLMSDANISNATTLWGNAIITALGY